MGADKHNRRQCLTYAVALTTQEHFFSNPFWNRLNLVPAHMSCVWGTCFHPLCPLWCSCHPHFQPELCPHFSAPESQLTWLWSLRGAEYIWWWGFTVGQKETKREKSWSNLSGYHFPPENPPHLFLDLDLLGSEFLSLSQSQIPSHLLLLSL